MRIHKSIPIVAVLLSLYAASCSTPYGPASKDSSSDFSSKEESKSSSTSEAQPSSSSSSKSSISIDDDEAVHVDSLRGGSNAYRVQAALNDNGENPLVESFRLNGIDYYMFKVGTVYDVPMQNDVVAKHYAGATDDTIEFETVVSTEESLEEAIEDAKSNTCGYDFSWGASFGAEDFVKASIDFRDSYSSSHGFSHSESVTKAVRYTNTYRSSESYSFKVGVSKVGYYRHILLSDIDFYYVEAFDTETGDKIGACDYSTVTGYAICLEYSESKSFAKENFEKLDLHVPTDFKVDSPEDFTERYHDYVSDRCGDKTFAFLPDLGLMRINLKPFYKRGEVGTVSAIDYDYFSGGELVIYPKYQGKPVYSIVFEGSYMEEDSWGIKLSEVVDGLSIRFSEGWDRAVNIEIANLGLSSPKGEAVFDFSNLSDVNLSLRGKNKIVATGANQTSIIKGKSVRAKGENQAELEMLSTSKGTVKGATAFSIENLAIENLKLDVSAGSGANGNPGTNYGVNDKSRSANNGGNGQSGRAGGDVFDCEVLLLDSVKAKLSAGSGGDGGNGGSGQGADSGTSLYYSGRGGAGGDGGNAGSIFNVASILNIKHSSFEVVLGNGGNAGNGGVGGNGHKESVSCVGQGGEGGVGGNGGASGLLFNERSESQALISDISVTLESGKGGNGGRGGNAGITDNNWFTDVHGSPGGAGGKGGDCRIGGESLFGIQTSNNTLVSGRGGKGGNSSGGNISGAQLRKSGDGGDSGYVYAYDFIRKNQGSSGTVGYNAEGGVGGEPVTVSLAGGVVTPL